MEFDSQLLQDLLEFLRTLKGIELPAKLETLRGRLLGRMQTALSSGNSYMEMQPGKPPKDIHIVDNSSEEYVMADQQPLSPRSFLYQHQIKKPDILAGKPPVSSPSRPPKSSYVVTSSPPPPTAPIVAPPGEPEVVKEVVTEDLTLEEYRSMTLMQAKDRSDLFDQFRRREKWLLFENLRPFWAALIGSYLLSFDNKTDQRPSQILSIDRCMCRPMDGTQRNAKKFCESTFELLYEDNKSFQFIAPTPIHMEKWVAMIIKKKSKSPETKKVHPTPKEALRTVTPIPEAETSSDESDLSEIYDDVIPDIAVALAEPATPSKSKMLREIKPKPDPPKPTIQVSPRRANISTRVLPPPPSTMESSQEDDGYHIIEDDVRPSSKARRESPSGSENRANAVDELYDDLDNVKREVEQNDEAKNSRREIARRNIPEQESTNDDTGTYDDVAEVKKEAEQIRMNENQMWESSEIEKEKNSPKEVPAPSTKASPVKNFFGRFTHKNESPPKEAAKKKPIIASPQKMGKTVSPIEVTINQSPLEIADEYHNGHTDTSDYNSPPSPRPVQEGKPFSNDMGYDDGEPLYDDVANKGDRFNNHDVDSERELKKGKRDDNLVKKSNSRPLPSREAQRKVVRNLNRTFDPEIYENQPRNENLEESFEYYQVPRADANAHSSIPSDDDDNDKMYDDVKIVDKKRQENEQAKQKPASISPSKSIRGPPVMAKPLEKNSSQKSNKFILSVKEKSASAKNIQHRFIAEKKSQMKEVIMPVKEHEVTSGNDDIYDDCQANK